MKRLCIFVGAMVLGVSPGVAQATNGATALLVGGKGGYAQLTEEEMSTAFGGYFADYDKRVGVPIPGTDLRSAITVGADNLYADIYSTPGPKTIGGVSQGAPAIPVVLVRLMNDMNNPASAHYPGVPADQLNVAVYGFPSRRWFGFVPYTPFPQTPYDVLIVFAQYDGIADFPNNPFNLLAVTNALMGADQLHVKDAYYDIRNLPTDYTLVTNSLGGTTTTIMIPTPVLPLLQPMLDKGADPAKVAQLDALLRPMIDRAYKRPQWQVGIPPTLTGPPTASATTTTSTMTVSTSSLAPESIPASVVLPTAATRTTTDTPEQPASPPEPAADGKTTTTDQPQTAQQVDDPVTPQTGAAPEVTTTAVANDPQPTEPSADPSADANTTGSQSGSETAASQQANGGTRAAKSTHRAGTHSVTRKFGRNKQ
ncbi:PE-PPE domain-containing protein [Mycolicibacterium chubuense NBB4]|uniref:PE-PPE domain-containing protein n=1 Tax=Mycolicibacterium chubuense (strain NBB4) TaxID=710421 RepID=I4BJB7_MYCCN|nr:PE-PPE domain-containing protein [Mycolicibacterium chubuense]AFM17374.1 PE-PPE domain-containing protein [Mycolicibacterium chubuense NBB4]